MSWRWTVLGCGGVMVALGGLVAVGCGADGPSGTGPAPAAGEPLVTDVDYVWVRDGDVVAVRRSPVPDGAYGAHGVDYAPAT